MTTTTAMRCPSCGVERAPGARFCGECGASLAQRSCPACHAAVAASGQFCGDCGASLAAERRQITIMFVDLVGSTALSSRLDPEDLQDVVRDYQTAVAEVVTRFGGNVAQYLGDGLLVYFGYPDAIENTAERSCRAALATVEAVRTLPVPGGGPLAVRVGIASGLVVVGDVRAGSVADKLAIGDTPNLAARLQAMAPTDGILIADATRRMLGEQFVLEDVGEQTAKGLAAPVRVWRVVGERSAATRFEAARAGQVAPLVGRAAELDRIVAAWDEAAGGAGRLVLVRGEPGMGKSRLLLAALEACAGRGAAVVALQCSPYHTQSAFFPLVTWLRAQLAAGNAEEDLIALVRRAGLGVDAVARFAALLSMRLMGDRPEVRTTPDRERRETLLGFLALLGAVAGDAPLLVCLEDLHWADPSTHAFVELLAARIAAMRAMVLASTRPPAAPAWVVDAVVVNVEGLDRAAAAALVHAAAGVTVSAELVARIVAHTDGVPLFVEELTKSMLESRMATAVEPGGTSLDLPQTVRDSLTARLGRLRQGRAVAQLAAMLGRTFDDRLLRAIWPGSETGLRQGVDELVRAGMVFPSGAPTDERWTFKHALVQDAAYESMLKKERAAQHARIAAILERDFAALVADEPEVVARHYAAGGQWEPAARHSLAAGRRALAHNAHTEAIVHLEGAASAIARLAPGSARDVMASDVDLALLPALVAARGYGHPRVEEIGTRCVRLCDGIGDPLRRFTALFPMCTFHMVRANHAEALRLAVELVTIAADTADESLTIEADLVLGLCRFFAGELAEADRLLDACLAAYDPERHGDHARRFGQDPAVVALSYRAWLRWIQGDRLGSFAASEGAIASARATGHPMSVAFALTFAAWRSTFEGDVAAVRPFADELLPLCEREAIPVFHIHGRIVSAWVACGEGRGAEGIPGLRDGIRAYQETGSQCYLSLWLAFLASAELAAGEPEAGAATMRRARDELARSGERWARAEILRTAAQAARGRGDLDTAAALLGEAVALAAAQGARTWELRAGRDLAELLWRSGRHDDARARLDALIDRIPTGAPGPDADTALRLRETFERP